MRACLSVRSQGLTSPPEYQPSAPSRLRPAKRAALCLPDPCGLGSDSHDGKVFSGKLLKSLTQTGSKGLSKVNGLGEGRASLSAGADVRRDMARAYSARADLA